MEITGCDSNYIIYDVKEKIFHVPECTGVAYQLKKTSYSLEELYDLGMAYGKSKKCISKAFQEAVSAKIPTVIYRKSYLKVNEKPMLVNVGFIVMNPQEQVLITLEDEISNAEINAQCLGNDFDELTGLYNRKAFAKALDKHILELDPADCVDNMLVYFDVQRFKAINDMFGIGEGDKLLKYIANLVMDMVPDGLGCRIGSDRFMFFTACKREKMDAYVRQLFDDICAYDLPFEISCNAGISVLDNTELSADALIDRAIMAQSVIKGSYTKQIKHYTEDIRIHMMSEQDIVGSMKTALNQQQFCVYYQPQYNHSTGMLVGAEALVRWKHPVKGLISPGDFIPVFEKNGFITKLDLYVFEKVCIYVKKSIEKGRVVVPISINLTRFDILTPGFIDQLDEIRRKYEVPSKKLRVEITESAAIGNSQYINEAVKKLHNYGFVVEMDDFGSGYSSLNILKDIDFDVIKLDMEFLKKDKDGGNRGGTILGCIVRMVNWLGLPIVAEGVETVKQADYLRSIGCEYIQGYLYSKPLPEKEYDVLLSGNAVGAVIPEMQLMDNWNSFNFWSSESLETLIFSNFVGGAAIFEYTEGKAEILRVNRKYLIEMGMNMSEKELIHTDPMMGLVDEDRDMYINMLNKAIETGKEEECETWRFIHSDCCGEDSLCIRSTVQMIGKRKGSYLFYSMIRNITGEKNKYNAILDSERRFKAASEQVNIYYWEYTIATKEMRPCFRCMRDLGLPALLTNYPDSAIEMGVFPPEIADMYRKWHMQIAEGVPFLEAVLPLTMDRIPFHVRYTTEFDENGRAIKAYGSAALVVD